MSILATCSTTRRRSQHSGHPALHRGGNLPRACPGEVPPLIGYPVNPVIEAAAEADIRTIMVCQERIGLHMCNAIAKVTSGDRISVFTMRHGPGTENAFGGVVQSWGFLPGRRAARPPTPLALLPSG